MKKVTMPALVKKKGVAKISMVTCYDASFAKLVEKAEIDSILVGDSLGMVIKGDTNTLEVDISEVEYHVKAVRKGAKTPFLIADMPFGSYQITVAKGLKNAVALMKAGAEAVKVEGGKEVSKLIQLLLLTAFLLSGMWDLLLNMSINSVASGNGAKRPKKESSYLIQPLQLKKRVLK
jgi:3-methyl-2-oxobutanoate hydroxymethyltransferase